MMNLVLTYINSDLMLACLLTNSNTITVSLELIDEQLSAGNNNQITIILLRS